jgi:anti-anti-sigma regulatory factor
MSTESLTEHILLLTLPRRPQSSCDIHRATAQVSLTDRRHVIIDFSSVEIMPSSTISELIIIENRLHEVGRQLVLCRVPHKIRELLVRVGLASLFRFAENQEEALELLERCSCPES